MKRFCLILCAWLLGLVMAPGANAEIKLPEGFVAEVVAADFEQPTAFDFLPDGRILVAERAGVVKIVKDQVIYARPLIDLRDEVNIGGLDRGLLDVAVDPKFTANGYIYLLYIYDAPWQKPDIDAPRTGRLVRYTVIGNVADRDSALVLLDDYLSDTRNHGVGSLRFAPNGALFVSLGDGALSEQKTDLSYRAQDLDSLNGKIIRINPATGAGVAPKWGGEGDDGNPFFDKANPKSIRSRIWSLGYRNPFRMGVDPASGVPYIGDVGWNTVETVQQAQAGGNAGWPCVEGDQIRPEYQNHLACETLKSAGVASPVYTYSHSGANASVTGGAFNPGGHFPESMKGAYFFADYSKQFIKYASLAPDGKFKVVLRFGEGVGEPVDLKFSDDGKLFYLSIFSGGLRQIRYISATISAQVFPEISCERSPCTSYDGSILGKAPLTVTLRFISAISTANNVVTSTNSVLRHQIDFGDTFLPYVQTGGNISAAHIYTTSGTYVVRFRADSSSRWVERRVIVGDAPPSVDIKSPSNFAQVLPSTLVQLDATARDAFGSNLPAAPMYWWVNLIAGGEQRVLASLSGPHASFTLPNNLPDDAKIEVICAALAPNYHVGVQQITLYPRPSDGYIRTWWLTRGYPNRSIDDIALGDEKTFLPKAGDVQMQVIHSFNKNIGLKLYVTPNEETFTQASHIAYAGVWLQSPEDRKGLLGLNSDESIAVWLNGQEVWRNRVNRPFPDDLHDIDLPEIKLNKGLNRLLIKVVQTNASNATWAFKARVLNADGSIMTDVIPIILPD